MGQKPRDISPEEAWNIYHGIYTKNVQKRRKRAERPTIDDPKKKEIPFDDERLIRDLEKREQKPWEIIASARAFGRREYKRKMEAYERELAEWTPESGKAKPRPPHRDSLINYIKRMGQAQTRNKSQAQADAIIKGNFQIPYVDKKTGEIKYRKPTRDDVYFSTPEQLDEWFYDKIRRRRKELYEKNGVLDEEDPELEGDDLDDWVYGQIAREFFGSP